MPSEDAALTPELEREIRDRVAENLEIMRLHPEVSASIDSHDVCALLAALDEARDEVANEQRVAAAALVDKDDIVDSLMLAERERDEARASLAELPTLEQARRIVSERDAAAEIANRLRGDVAGARAEAQRLREQSARLWELVNEAKLYGGFTSGVLVRVRDAEPDRREYYQRWIDRGNDWSDEAHGDHFPELKEALAAHRAGNGPWPTCRDEEPCSSCRGGTLLAVIDAIPPAPAPPPAFPPCATCGGDRHYCNHPLCTWDSNGFPCMKCRSCPDCEAS